MLVIPLRHSCQGQTLGGKKCVIGHFLSLRGSATVDVRCVGV